MEHLNETQWNEMVELLDEDFKSLVEGYLSDCVVRLNNIKKAQESNDNELGLDASHAMKGASLNIGAEVLAKHCGIMQTVCEAKIIDSAFNVIEDIEQALDTVTAIINEKLDAM